MKAMVLCAGLGTRLRPLTNRWPKPAVPLLGAPLLRPALSILTAAGIKAVGVNTHYLPQVMERVAHEEAARAGLSLEVSPEPEIQGTGGGIRGLRTFLRDADFVVTNPDVLFAVDLAPIIRAHRESGASATMVLLPMPAGAKYNAVELDGVGHVRRIAGKGPGGERLTGWHFTGVHVMSPEVFDFMSASGPEDINQDVYVRMLERGRIIAGHCLRERDVYWSDLGNPVQYLATHQQLLFGQVPTRLFGSADPFAGVERVFTNSWAHASAALNNVRVAGPAWFGADCVLEDDVRIGAAVSIGQRARIGKGAALNRVAVLDGAEVAPGVLIEDAVVAPGGVVVKTNDAPSC